MWHLSVCGPTRDYVPATHHTAVTPTASGPAMAIKSAYSSRDESLFRTPSPAVSSRSHDSVDSGLGSDEPNTHSQEFALLGSNATKGRSSKEHELRTAPLFTRGAFLEAGKENTFPQRGLFGSVIPQKDQVDTADPRIYVNTNAPFSAVVCGVQGSGKSHSVAVMLENMLISHTAIGQLEKPLAGLVLHVGEGSSEGQASEAAWIGSSPELGVKTPRIVVYVSPSYLSTMRAKYARVGRHIKVEPLVFHESELDAKAFLTLMAVVSDSAPLYMQTVMSILRKLGEDYTYSKFIAELYMKKCSMLKGQVIALEQRLELLRPFVSARGLTAPSRFAPGQLTIVDLSDPFIDPAQACNMFEIFVRLFVRAEVDTGKVLVVDEAHKYLGINDGKSALTKELLSLIRQQRHLAMRVIISTQEPTVVPPVILDLCTVAILHRFSSPSWLAHVEKHVAANVKDEEAFDQVVRLETGQAIVLAPSALTVQSDGKLVTCSRRYLLVKTRNRITRDGGASVLVVD